MKTEVIVMKRFLVLPCLALMLSGAPGRSAAAAEVTFYVDNLTSCAGLTPCFTTIQGAVDAAGPDTAVEVFPGVYREAVRIVAKTRLELGPHGAVGPVIAAPVASDAIQIIQSPGARVSGFIVEAPDRTGILVAGGASASPTVEDNFIRSAGGVAFMSVDSCVARRNTVAGGLLYGGGGRQCVLEDNVVEGTISFDESGTCGARNNTVRGNLVRGGDIGFSGRCTENNLIESNRVDGGGIGLQGSIGVANLIRTNLVRGGVLDLHGNVAANTIEGNFVSGSPTDGIRVAKSVGMGPNTIQRNTAVNNGVCDINEILPPFTPPNVWMENRYITKCGAAETGAATAVRP
jgi:hypothetical protein